MRFVVLNDSRHNVGEALRKQFGSKAEIKILTDAPYPSFEGERDVLQFAEELADKISEDDVVVLTGTSEVVFLVLFLLMRKYSRVQYATFDFMQRAYKIREFNYLDLR